MLEGERRAAGRRVDAQRPGHADEARQRRVEHLHVDAPDIAANPLVEHRDEEAPVALGGDRALGDVGPGRDATRGGQLDDGDELDVLRAEVVAQEAVDLQSVVLVRVVHGGQHVPAHPVRLEPVQPGDDAVERRLAALVDAVGVVEFARAVDRDADQEVLCGEELRPLVVDEGAVGLDRVLDDLVGPAVALDEVDHSAEELDTHERRLAALPGDRDLGVAVRLEQLPDVRLQQPVVHPERAAGVELLLGQEEAVRAVEVADRAGGLPEHVERRGDDRRRAPSVSCVHAGQSALPSGRGPAAAPTAEMRGDDSAV